MLTPRPQQRSRVREEQEYQHIGEQIRRLRHLMPGGWSRVKLSRRAGVDYWRVGKIETGVARPRPGELRRLERVLGVTLTDAPPAE